MRKIERDRGMTREEKAVIGGAVVGVLLALTFCLLFGVLDIQCGSGMSWNASHQICE